MEMLTTKQVADLTGQNARTIQRKADSGKIDSKIVFNNRNQKEYLIPITALDIKLQAKYHKQQGAAIAPIPMPSNKVEGKAFDCYSEDERKEIAFWIDIVEKLLEYRRKSTTSKGEVDRNYVAMLKLENPDLAISTDTLYRRLNAYKADNLGGLLDNRGKWRDGQSTVLEPMWQTFLFYFLDESEPSVAQCYKYTKESIKLEFPELYDLIPHDASFRRRIDADLPIQLQILGRKGLKAFRDACGLFIRRIYDEMLSNDYWVGDTHTLDIQSDGGDGKPHRLYLSAFMDARSGIFTGWHVSTNATSQTSVLALRDGMVRRKSIPKFLYTDNGREFLTFDFGGLGHRTHKSKEDKFETPTILKRLGIGLVNALPKNAQAKVIERRFKDFKEQISKTFESYTGGNIMERPERLKAHIKSGKVINDKELIEQVNQFIEFYMNYEQYGGAVTSDHGKRKIDVYNEHLSEISKPASEAELNLMLMRSSRPQTVGQRGVHLIINGEQFDYFNDDLRNTMMGKQVYYRYDPADLSEVRVYDLKNRYIMTVPADSQSTLKYGDSQDKIKAAVKATRKAERYQLDKLNEIRSLNKTPVHQLLMAQCLENMRNPATQANPKLINIQRADEQPLYRAVSGGGMDLKVMTANAIKRQEEQA